jgi:hypothetical protein
MRRNMVGSVRSSWQPMKVDGKEGNGEDFECSALNKA